MTYHKEGPACGRIPCDPTSSEADCEYPFDKKTPANGVLLHGTVMPDFFFCIITYFFAGGWKFGFFAMTVLQKYRLREMPSIVFPLV